MSKNYNEFLEFNHAHLLCQILVDFLHQVITTCLRRGEEGGECNNKSLEKEQNITETNSLRINYVITKMIRKYRILLLIKGNK